MTVARGARADVLAAYRGPEWTVDELQVVESRLGARAVHTVLERVRLSPA